MRLFPRLFMLIILTLCLSNCHQPDKELLVLPGDGFSDLSASIDSARHSIDLVMYGFTDEKLANALIRAQKRGVKVRVMLQHHPYKNEHENDNIVAKLKKSNVTVKWSNPNFTITHQKTLIVDREVAYVMTFNFTYNTLHSERNFALVVRQPKLITQIEGVFNADWHGKKNFKKSSKLLVWSPDNSERRIISLIGSAKHSVKVYNQEFASAPIMRALERKAESGVLVQLIVPLKNYSTYKHNLHTVANKGVEVRLQSQLYTHAKVVLVDANYPAAKTLVGSMNFSYFGLNKNRELGMIDADKQVAQQMSHVFDNDWALAKPIDVKHVADGQTVTCSDHLCRLAA